jgi:hypothetical protein
MNWRLLTRRDLLSIVLLVALLGAVGAYYGFFSDLGRKMNHGFGPEWSCTRVGDADPVCIKKAPDSASRD